jgi:cysteine-rich repeat protein
LCGITEPLYTSSWDGSWLTSLFSWLCDAGVSVDFKYYPWLHSRWWRCLGEQWAQDTLCELKERWCGDGMIDFNAWEMCDDGNQTDGDGCDSTCSLESVVQPYLENTGLCHQNIQPLVVQSNEIIPLTWSLDVVSGVDKNATWCDDLWVWTFIPWWTLLCEIEINQLETITVPCLWFNNWSRELFEDVIEDYDRSLSKTIWWSILDVGMLGVWRQALQLKNISYTYCDTTREGAKRYHTYQEDEGVCMMPLTIINPYRIEKWSTLSTTQEAQMQQITNESWEVLIDTQAIESVTASNSTIDVKKILALFMEQFVDDHRWWSIIPAFPFGADQSTKKSLTDRLHFFMGSQTRGSIRIDDHFLANPEKPFSLVVENADLILEWSLEWNGMYIVDGGDIIFESQNCDMTNTIEGVFITDGTFKTSSTLNTDPYASQRCKWWNLVINGLFIGEWLNTEFVSRRRAQVDLRSFEDLNQSDSEEQLVQNRLNQSKRLIEWPSVRIDTSPLSWSELPPGVRELFEVIAVRK